MTTIIPNASLGMGIIRTNTPDTLRVRIDSPILRFIAPGPRVETLFGKTPDIARGLYSKNDVLAALGRALDENIFSHAPNYLGPHLWKIDPAMDPNYKIIHSTSPIAPYMSGESFAGSLPSSVTVYAKEGILRGFERALDSDAAFQDPRRLPLDQFNEIGIAPSPSDSHLFVSRKSPIFPILDTVQLKDLLWDLSSSDYIAAPKDDVRKAILRLEEALRRATSSPPHTPTKRILLGFTGRAGAGKDTAAQELLCDGRCFTRLCFATPLKEGCQALFDLTHDQLHDPVEKEVVDERWGMTPRHILQFLGTDVLREKVDQDFFITHMRSRIAAATENADIVITDVRFDNEAALIRELGGRIVRISRRDGGGTTLSAHATEGGISDHLVDFQLRNDGTAEELHQKVRELVGRFRSPGLNGFVP